MTEFEQKEFGDISGSSGSGSQLETTQQPDPTVSVEQSEPNHQTETTENTGSQVSNGDDTFFDPKSIEHDENLLKAYKQMQGSFTKKTQEYSKLSSAAKQKIEAYDAFYNDPIGFMDKVATNLGYQVTKKGEEAQQQDFEPQTWEDVLDKASKLAEERILKKISPMANQVSSMQRESLMDQLSKINPNWKDNETEFIDNLRRFPELANDLHKLNKLSTPDEVLERIATQKALKKLESKNKSVHMTGKSTTTRMPKQKFNDKPRSFQEAVEVAKARLAENGIKY